LIIAMLLLAMGCDRQPATVPIGYSTTRPSGRNADLLDVFEAVFRYQFAHNASGAQPNVGPFFLALDKKTDPPAELMGRFSGDKPVVMPMSQADISPSKGVRQRNGSGGKGLLLYLGTITWIDMDTAEVIGGYYEGNLSASKNIYRIVRKNGRWSVISDQLFAIS